MGSRIHTLRARSGLFGRGLVVAAVWAAALGLAVPQARAAEGGPDAFGYHFIDNRANAGPGSAVEFVSVAGNGAGLPIADTITFTGVPIGFTFFIAGVGSTFANVDDDGNITLDNGGGGGAGGLIGLAAPGGVDLDPSSPVLHADTVGTVFAQTVGSAPNRRFVVEWESVSVTAPAANPAQIHFEIVLIEGSTIFYVIMAEAGDVPTDDGTGTPPGPSNITVVSDEDNDGTIDLTYPGSIYPGLLVAFYQGALPQRWPEVFEEKRSQNSDSGFFHAVNDHNKSGCFIASATYGSPMTDEVGMLSRFRDDYLMSNGPGRAFVHWYYRTSPPWARRIAGSPAARSAVRVALKPLVWYAGFMTGSSGWDRAAFCGLVIGLGAVPLRVLRRRRRRSLPAGAQGRGI